MKHKAIIAGCLLFFAAISHAGTHGGNGGYAVQCYESDVTKGDILAERANALTTELLDFHEMQLVPKFLVGKGTNKSINIALGGNNFYGDEEEIITQKVTNAFNRLAKIDSKLAAKYKEDLETIFSKIAYVTPDDAYFNTYDSGRLVLAKNCIARQVVIQNLLGDYPGTAEYLIRKDLWNKLPVDHKAGLIIHEIVYKSAIRAGHIESTNSRYFTALIASDLLETMPQDEYSKELFRTQMVGKIAEANLSIAKDIKVNYRFWMFKGPRTYDAAKEFCESLSKVHSLKWRLLPAASELLVDAFLNLWFIKDEVKDSPKLGSRAYWLGSFDNKIDETQAQTIQADVYKVLHFDKIPKSDRRPFICVADDGTGVVE